MHIAQLNLVPAPPQIEPGDLPVHWHTLADVADAVASAGVRVSVIQNAAREAAFVRAGVEYRFLPLDGKDGPRRLAAALVGAGAGLAHVHGLDFAPQAHALSKRLPWLPILLQDHANRPPGWWRRAPWRRWYAAAAGVAFTAPALAAPFVEAKLFRPGTRVFAIPESSCRFTPGDRAQARYATGLHGYPCVLWVGHLAAGKDPLAVLDGVALAARRLPDLQLWCAYGNAPMREAVQARIARDPWLAGRVHLLGRVPHEKVELLQRAADIFVAGSRAESCGYAALEAMACGAVPVLTDIPSFRALTGDGRLGRLWPCGDTGRLADALVAMAAAGPTRAEVRAHFDAELSFAAVGRRWAEAYAALLAGRPRAAAWEAA
ncbi:glycosyltransferase [Dyella sp. SG609]|uniref:glycosyltransferase n=1 Tax=Dyella sp. SG609 TaxID=2587018 RepID=UPI001448062F|nr:glycosyltransferase involved in cell wall biosynthesis [Dyella sp. SG609]